ncbi:MAG: septum formation initiator family protein [Candidatus Dadabacteria bacterium]|nr:septum formation initiator family protein [Candidatus Dadabacteria bacterium]
MKAAIIRNTVILTLTLLIVYIFIRQTSKVYVLSEENSRIGRKVENLEKVNENLNIHLKLLKEDESYIEKVAREELGMIKHNEKIYRFDQ